MKSNISQKSNNYPINFTSCHGICWRNICDNNLKSSIHTKYSHKNHFLKISKYSLKYFIVKIIHNFWNQNNNNDLRVTMALTLIIYYIW